MQAWAAITGITGLVLLFFWPIGTAVGVLLLFLSNTLSNVHNERLEESRRQKANSESKRINQLHNELDDIEDAYLEYGIGVFENDDGLVDNRYILSLNDYQQACEDTSRPIAQEIVKDWQDADRREAKRLESLKPTEVREHEATLLKLLQPLKNEANPKDLRDEIIKQYDALDIPKGKLSIRLIHGRWKIKVRSAENSELDIDLTI